MKITKPKTLFKLVDQSKPLSSQSDMNHSYLQFLPRLHVINIVNSSSVNLNPTSKHFWTRTNDDRRSAIEPGNTINTNATFIIFIILTRIGDKYLFNPQLVLALLPEMMPWMMKTKAQIKIRMLGLNTMLLSGLEGDIMGMHTQSFFLRKNDCLPLITHLLYMGRNEAEAMEKARELAEKDDIESDVAAMYVEESEDIALFPSSKSQPNESSSYSLSLLSEV
ncbi:hypothetical protein MJO29_001750 [Puccinia striiformis f. sp. tritici]|nr:hypothetical protein MJO29_001750 [Puccinia striiformis f. sp. tritici]